MMCISVSVLTEVIHFLLGLHQIMAANEPPAAVSMLAFPEQ